MGHAYFLNLAKRYAKILKDNKCGNPRPYYFKKENGRYICWGLLKVGGKINYHPLF